jgi:hypothetical protein
MPTSGRLYVLSAVDEAGSVSQSLAASGGWG